MKKKYKYSEGPIEESNDTYISTVKEPVGVEPTRDWLEIAMKYLGLSRKQVFAYKKYPDKLVIVTTNGRKLTYMKDV